MTDDAAPDPESSYRALFNAIDEGFCLIDMLYDAQGRAYDYRFVDANPVFEQQTGLVNAMGRTVLEMVPGHDQHWFEIYGRVAETGEPQRFTQRAEALNRWYDVYAFRVGTPGSRRVAVLFRDSSERIRQEQELRDNEERARLAIGISQLGTFRYLIGDDTVELDERMRRIWGEPEGGGRLALDYTVRRIHPEDRPRVVAALIEAQRADVEPAARGRYDIDYRIVWADGSERWVAANGQVQFDGDGPDATPRVLNGTVLDITERKRTEVSLRELQGRLAFLLRLSDALRPLEDIPAMQATACRLLGDHLEVNRVCFVDIEGEEFTVSAEYHRGVAAFEGRGPVSAFGGFLGGAYALGDSVDADDVQHDIRFTEEERATLMAFGIAAFAGVPLIRQGRLLSAFGVHNATPRHWKSSELLLLEAVSERVWAASERALAEAELRQRESELARVQRVGHVGGVDVNVAGGLAARRSPEYIRLHGLAPGTRHESHDDWLRRVHPDDRAAAAARLHDALAGAGSSYESEYRIVRPDDGRVRWISAVADIERDELGRALRLVGAHIDITERKEAEEALRESDERQAFLLRLSDRLALLADPLAVKATAAHLLGEHCRAGRAYYAEFDSEAELYLVHGDHVRDHETSLAGVHPAAAYAAVHAALLENRPYIVADTATAVGTTAAERDRFAELGIRGLAAVPLVKAGRLVAALVLTHPSPRAWTSTDVLLLKETAQRAWAAIERARVETALHAREEQLREADARKDEFLATLAHELRNPLAPIRNSLHLLRRGGNGPQAPRLYDMLERQVGHMVRLIDDLMEVSRISRGAIELRRESLNLATVVGEAIEAARGSLERAEHRFTFSLPSEPMPVLGDPVRLVQIVSNLLSNAVRYTDTGGSVDVRVWRDGATGLVAVSDSGIGIPADKLAGLFAMFGQVDRADPRSQGGLGIGLALAQRLAQLHGGGIEARSAGRGQGSRFTLRLPLAGPPAETGEAPRTDTPVPSAAAPCTVLVVDDNQDAAESTALMLQLEGLAARVAHSGEEALALLAQWRPDVALVDLGMPGMDGYEVARRIRADTRLDGLPLIALTGWGQPSDLQRTRAAGFRHHLVKLVDLGRLLALLRDPTIDAGP